MTGVFKANNPFNPFLLFVYGLLLKLGWYFKAGPLIIHHEDGFLYKAIINKLSSHIHTSFFYFAAAYLLIFVQALMFNRILNNMRLMPRHSFLPAMSYLLITSFLPQWNFLSSSLLINSFIIWAFSKIFKFYNTPQPKSLLFNTGIIFGIISLLYFPAIVLCGIMFIGLAITRPAKIQEWVFALLGILTPWYFLASFMYLNNKFTFFKIPEVFFRVPLYSYDKLHAAGYFIIFLLFFIGVFYVQNHLQKQVIQTRKNGSILFIYILIAFLLALFNKMHIMEYFLLAILPVCAYAGAAFYYIKKRWVAEIIHLSFAGLIIYSQYFLK